MINSVHGYMIAEASCCQSRLAFCLCFFSVGDCGSPRWHRWSSQLAQQFSIPYAQWKLCLPNRLWLFSLKLGEPQNHWLPSLKWAVLDDFQFLHFPFWGNPWILYIWIHRPRVCAYAIAWHNSLSLIEYVDCVGSRPFLGGVRKGRCCYQGAGDGTQKFLTRNPPSKPSQAASWFLSCTLWTETCQHMLPLTSFLYNMYLQHVATDLNCIVIIIIITCVYIYIVDRIKGSWIIPEAYHPWSVQWNPLATCVHNREHPPVRSSPRGPCSLVDLDAAAAAAKFRRKAWPREFVSDGPSLGGTRSKPAAAHIFLHPLW